MDVSEAVVGGIHAGEASPNAAPEWKAKGLRPRDANKRAPALRRPGGAAAGTNAATATGTFNIPTTAHVRR